MSIDSNMLDSLMFFITTFVRVLYGFGLCCMLSTTILIENMFRLQLLRLMHMTYLINQRNFISFIQSSSSLSNFHLCYNF